MDKTIYQQYFGFLNTPPLWIGKLYGLNQFELNSMPFKFGDNLDSLNQRLGKRIENFMGFHLSHHSNIKLFAKNIQVKDVKETIGELDMILQRNGMPIHLEIAYKFYLLDPEIIPKNSLEQWIGPNRKDNLNLKFDKLKNKQLPLLYNNANENNLSRLELNSDEILQEVCFKA